MLNALAPLSAILEAKEDVLEKTVTLSRGQNGDK